MVTLVGQHNYMTDNVLHKYSKIKIDTYFTCIYNNAQLVSGHNISRGIRKRDTPMTQYSA